MFNKYIYNILLDGVLIHKKRLSKIIFCIVLCLSALSAQASWRPMGYGNLGSLISCSSSIPIACFNASSVNVDYIYGSELTAIGPNGQQYRAQWIGIYGSFAGYITSLSPSTHCSISGCPSGFVIGEPGSFEGVPDLSPRTNMGCRSPGISCGPISYFYAQLGAPSEIGKPIPSSTDTVNVSVSIRSDEATWILLTDGPSGYYTGPFSGSVRGYQVGRSLPYMLYVCMDAQDGATCATSTVATAGLVPDFPLPPEVGDPVVCNFSTDGDIDLGTVDSSSASGRYASTYLYTQCTDDATVTARIQKSGGGNNQLQMGGLNMRVIFEDGSDTKTYSANTYQTQQIIWGQVTNAGTLTPGEYSQSMIVYLNYE